MQKILLFILLSSSFYTADLHKFYVSRCMIEYKQDQKALQVSMHIFIDDLERALEEMGAKKLFICTRKEAEEADQHIYNYLNKHFILSVDGESQPYQYVGKEISEDFSGVWIYLEVTDVEVGEQLMVKNNILMEIFDDQKNIVSVKGMGTKEHYFLFRADAFEEIITL